jgi:hypothetical protein
MGIRIRSVNDFLTPPCARFVRTFENTGAKASKQGSAGNGSAYAGRIREWNAQCVAQDLPKERALSAAVCGYDAMKFDVAVGQHGLAINEAEGDAFEHRSPCVRAPVMHAPTDGGSACGDIPERCAFAFEVRQK